MDVSYLLHATEDAEKVAFAVRELIDVEAPFEFVDMAGHYGNDIRKVSVHLHGEDATKAFTRLAGRMPREMRELVARDIDRFVDEHASLYMRFDKQRLVEGEISIGYGEAIRLKVKPRAYLTRGRGRDFFLEQLKAR